MTAQNLFELIDEASWTDGSDDTLKVQLVRDGQTGELCAAFSADTYAWLTASDLDELLAFLAAARHQMAEVEREP